MKIGIEFDGEEFHVDARIPSAEARDLVNRFYAALFSPAEERENDNEDAPKKKGGSKKRGGP